jgi:hypothetical protein
MKPFEPRSIRSVALCEAHDSVLSPLLESHPGMEIVLYPGDEVGTFAIEALAREPA